jgi:hypothetical protein
MIMGEDRLLNVGQVNVQITRILQNRLWMATCVQQNTVTIGFYQRGETPFTQTRSIAHQHAGKHGDFKRMDLLRRRGNARGGSLACRRLRSDRWDTKRRRSGNRD